MCNQTNTIHSLCTHKSTNTEPCTASTGFHIPSFLTTLLWPQSLKCNISVSEQIGEDFCPSCANIRHKERIGEAISMTEDDGTREVKSESVVVREDRDREGEEDGGDERASECGSVCTLWPGPEEPISNGNGGGGMHDFTEQRKEIEGGRDTVLVERDQWGQEVGIQIEIQMPQPVLLADRGVRNDVEMADLGETVGSGNGERIEREPFPRAELLGGGERRLV